MFRHFLLLSFLFFAAVFPAQAQILAEDHPVVGTVLEVEGTAAIHSNGRVTAATLHTPVRYGDTVTTGAASRVFVQFLDETEIILSEKTELKVDDYIYDPEGGESRAAYSILKGVFYYVSGLIGKDPGADIKVETIHGSIGVRGTQFWGGDIDGTYGVLLAEGAVDVKTEAGSVTLKPGEGTFLKGRRAMPVPPKVWAAEKTERAKATVRLQRQELVRQRVGANKARNTALRQKFKGFAEQRRRKRQDRREQRIDNRREHMQERLQDRRNHAPGGGMRDHTAPQRKRLR